MIIAKFHNLQDLNSRTCQGFSSTFKHLICFQALSRALKFLFQIQALSRISQARYEPCHIHKLKPRPHRTNGPELTGNKLTQFHDAFIGHAPHRALRYLALRCGAKQPRMRLKTDHVSAALRLLIIVRYANKKGKVFPYSLPSVGPGADPGVQAVSPQVT